MTDNKDCQQLLKELNYQMSLGHKMSRIVCEHIKGTLNKNNMESHLDYW